MYSKLMYYKSQELKESTIKKMTQSGNISRDVIIENHDKNYHISQVSHTNFKRAYFYFDNHATITSVTIRSLITIGKDNTISTWDIFYKISKILYVANIETFKYYVATNIDQVVESCVVDIDSTESEEIIKLYHTC